MASPTPASTKMTPGASVVDNPVVETQETRKGAGLPQGIGKPTDEMPGPSVAHNQGEGQRRGGISPLLKEYGWIAYIVLIVALYASRYFKKPSLPPTLVPISVPFKLSPGQSRGSLTHHILLEEDGDIVVRLGADPVADGGERGIARRGKELWRSNTGQGSACKKCSLTVGGDGTLWLKQGKKVLGKFSPGEVESLAKIVDVWV